MRNDTPRRPIHAPPRPGPAPRRAFTLAEALVSLGILSVLLVGMQSAIMLAGKAMPDANPLSAQVVDSRRAQEVVASDLAYATNIINRTATDVTFEVADRNGDAKPETIRFYWSGPGTSLMRVYNGVESVVSRDVRDFKLSYITRTVSKTETVSTEVEDASDKEVGAFTTHSSGSPSPKDFTVAGAAASTGEMKGWAAEYFKLKNIPSGASKVRFTRAEVRLKTYTSGQLTVSLGVSDPTVGVFSAAGTSTVPTVGTAVGGAGRLSRSGLSTTTYYPVIATLPDGATSTRINGGFYIVVKGHDSTSPTVYLQYLYNSKPPADTWHMEWSTNGGSTWQPAAADWNLRDMPFRVFGRYTTGSTTTTVTNTHYLTTVAMTLNGSDENQSRLDTAVQVLNEPQVSAP